jgi:hypothetical protein
MAVWRQGEPASSRKRRAKGVSAIVLARDRSLGANVNVRASALQAAQPWAHNSAADEPASRNTFGQRIHTSMQSLLASAAPSHSASAEKHPRTPTGGREAEAASGAEGSMGRKGTRKGGWGGRKAGAEAEGAWGGREHGVDGSMGRKGEWPRRNGVLLVWGEKEYGAEGSMGRMGVWGARHIPTHQPPL